MIMLKGGIFVDTDNRQMIKDKDSNELWRKGILGLFQKRNKIFSMNNKKSSDYV